MDNVLVIGAGYMGGGITQVIAQGGYTVYLQDVNEQSIEKTLAQIKWSTEKLASKGKIKDSAKAVQDRITVVKDLSIAPKCRWVIEVVFEDLKLKKEIFKELDTACPPETILATNSSTFPITMLADKIKHPERAVGMHFFGPVPLMRLVEVIRGKNTSDAVFQKAVDFVNSFGHVPVKVHKDVVGFLMNRINGAAFREAMSLVEKGVATPEDIDKGMHYGFNWNIGPFEIADNAGLDVYKRVGKAFDDLGAGNLSTSSKLIDKMVAAGRLGTKNSKGFYDHTPDGKLVPFDLTQLK
jgi:3-hydroxybutyryl-CoA dehydrogenase